MITARINFDTGSVSINSDGLTIAKVEPVCVMCRKPITVDDGSRVDDDRRTAAGTWGTITAASC